MPHKKYIEAYKNVTADSALKEKILQSAEENIQSKKLSQKLTSRWSAIIAACAMIALGIGLFGLQSDSARAEIIYKGGIITEEPTLLSESGAKAVNFGTQPMTASGLPLEIKVDLPTNISVSGGKLLVFGDNSEEIVFIGTSFTADRSVDLFWDLSKETDISPVLTVENQKEHSEYALEEYSDNVYIIRLIKSKTK